MTFSSDHEGHSHAKVVRDGDLASFSVSETFPLGVRKALWIVVRPSEAIEPWRCSFNSPCRNFIAIHQMVVADVLHTIGETDAYDYPDPKFGLHARGPMLAPGAPIIVSGYYRGFVPKSLRDQETFTFTVTFYGLLQRTL